jgi:hypothetical protein
MITGVDIKLMPVPGSQSGELFKFRLKQGTYFVLDYDTYSEAPSQYFPLSIDKVMTVTEIGNGFTDVVFKIPVHNIRYITVINV